MKKYVSLALFTAVCFLCSCSLIEPSCLIIKNDSSYKAAFHSDKGNKNVLVLEKSEGDMIMVYPGNLKLTVIIDEIGYKKERIIKIGYMEDVKFVFDEKIK